MIIRNFDQLASSSLQKQALLIAEAGLAKVMVPNIVKERVGYDRKRDVLTVRNQQFPLKEFRRVVVVGVGKAALQAVTELHTMLDQRLSCGFVIDITAGQLDNVVCKVGTHPYPTTVNVAATQELVDLLAECTENDFILIVVSGGGSSLLCSPKDLTCDEERQIIEQLNKAGASIIEVNTVRKHISKVKGGNLAKICYPATVASLIFSDVPGDDIGFVASGPTVIDTTTVHDAAEILRRYNILDRCKLPSCNLAETLKEQKYFERVHNILICSPEDALSGMQVKAEDLGWRVKVWNRAYQGEARDIAKQITQSIQSGVCLIGSGETTVTLIGQGAGGRNQEMALAVVPDIKEGEVFVTIASDGHDNSEAAGAIVDAKVRETATQLSLSPQQFLDNNDSFTFFHETGRILDTGLTGTNVSDFFVYLKQ